MFAKNHSLKHLFSLGIIIFIALVFYVAIFNFSKSAFADELIQCAKETERQNKTSCYDKIFNEYLTSHEPEDLLKSFEKTLSKNPVMRRDCHQIAHSMGRATYAKIGKISQVFELDREIESCAGGFFHGAIEKLFRPAEGEARPSGRPESKNSEEHITRAEMEKKIPTLCDSFSVGERKSECYHGIGHGVYYVTSDVKKSLSDCNLINSGPGKFSCYSGVFMEDNSSGKSEAECNNFAGKEKEACFFVLSFRLVDSGLKPEEIIKECGKIEGMSGELCKRGFGIFFLAHEALAEGNKPVAAFCASLNTKDARICMESVAARLTSTYENGSRSMPFCDEIQSEYLRVSCFSYIADVLRTKFGLNDDLIAKECNQFAREKQECIDFIDQTPEPISP